VLYWRSDGLVKPCTAGSEALPSSDLPIPISQVAEKDNKPHPGYHPAAGGGGREYERIRPKASEQHLRSRSRAVTAIATTAGLLVRPLPTRHNGGWLVPKQVYDTLHLQPRHHEGCGRS
jgi:hypothetical protein